MNVLDKALISIGNAVPRILGDLDPKAVIDGAESSISDGGKLSGFSDKVDDIGGGVYHIVYKVGIFVALVGIVWAASNLLHQMPALEKRLSLQLSTRYSV